MDSSKIPDLIAIILLTSAFASIARHHRVADAGARLWLIGWSLIALHLTAQMFLNLTGIAGLWASYLCLASLAWAAILFQRASVPYQNVYSSRWMCASFAVTNSLYIGLIVFWPESSIGLSVAAILYGVFPLTVALVSLNKFRHPFRWSLVGLNCVLACVLLVLQQRPGDGKDLALDAVLCACYLACCFHFWYCSRPLTTGGFITASGFLAWSQVFVIAPLFRNYCPNVHVENEVWNLPKYIVATGMILMILERQLEHNKYLALHDELTGLPNRRLFQDRLQGTVERARRNHKAAALLLIDLDGFKQVNDSLGHSVGDQLLRQVGMLFSARLRRSDTVARTGGDEFAVILEEPVSRADAAGLARALTRILDSPVKLDQHSVHIGASVGVALFPDDASDAELLYAAADLSMYEAKACGRRANRLDTNTLPTFACHGVLPNNPVQLP